MATDDDLAQLKALARRGDVTLWWQVDPLVERLQSVAVEALDDLLAIEVAGDRELASARDRTLLAVADALIPVLTPARLLSAVRLAGALLAAAEADGAHIRLPSTIGEDRFRKTQARVRLILQGIRGFAYGMPATERVAVVRALEEASRAAGLAWGQVSSPLLSDYMATLDAFRQESGALAPWIERLRSDDYGERKDATAQLASFGEAVVPALARELAQRHPHSQFRVVEALVAIGGRSAAWALVGALPKATLALRLGLPHALEVVLRPLATAPQRDDFDLFLAVVQSAKRAPEAADQAAGAIAGLARSAPFRELRLALKPLRGGLLNPPSPAFAEAHAAVESATAAWADLPLPSLPPSLGRDLPLPSEEPGG